MKHEFLPVLILTVLSVCSCKSAHISESDTSQGYQLIFDGKTLNGWSYDSVYWRVENDCLVGEVTPSTLLKRNTFIIKKNLTTDNFELKVDYRISAFGNSGINYRSDVIDSIPYAMKGYQADIDGQNMYTGQNYEERKRTTLAYRGQIVIVDSSNGQRPLSDQIRNNAWLNRTIKDSLGSGSELKQHIRNNDWNEYHLIVKGNRLMHYVNGFLMSDVTDNDTAHRKFSGLLGVQVHVGPPMKVEYKNFRIKSLN